MKTQTYDQFMKAQGYSKTQLYYSSKKKGAKSTGRSENPLKGQGRTRNTEEEMVEAYIQGKIPYQSFLAFVTKKHKMSVKVLGKDFRRYY